jgi:hypothetical protein
MDPKNIKQYTSHTLEETILSRLNVDQAGEVVSAEAWTELWMTVFHLLGSYNEHFQYLYDTLATLNSELNACVGRVDILERDFKVLDDKMATLQNTWQQLQATYDKIAGHYDEIKTIQKTLEDGFIHYGTEAPPNDFIKLWVLPTSIAPSLIQSWGANDIFATHYNYASAKLIKDTINLKVAKAGDTLTGTLQFEIPEDAAALSGNGWRIGSSGLEIPSIRIPELNIVMGKTSEGTILSFGGQRINNVAVPTADADVANKVYVDSMISRAASHTEAAAQQYTDTHQDLNYVTESDILNWELNKVYKVYHLAGSNIECDGNTINATYEPGLAMVIEVPSEEGTYPQKVLVTFAWLGNTAYVFNKSNDSAPYLLSEVKPFTAASNIKTAENPEMQVPTVSAVQSYITRELTALSNTMNNRISEVAFAPAQDILEWESGRIYSTAFDHPSVCIQCGDVLLNDEYYDSSIAYAIHRCNVAGEVVVAALYIQNVEGNRMYSFIRVGDSFRVSDITRHTRADSVANAEDPLNQTPTVQAVKDYVEDTVDTLLENSNVVPTSTVYLNNLEQPECICSTTVPEDHAVTAFVLDSIDLSDYDDYYIVADLIIECYFDAADSQIHVGVSQKYINEDTNLNATYVHTIKLFPDYFDEKNPQPLHIVVGVRRHTPFLCENIEWTHGPERDHGVWLEVDLPETRYLKEIRVYKQGINSNQFIIHAGSSCTVYGHRKRLN